MAFEDLLTSTDDWFLKPGPCCDVVVSSRVRFARNLEGKKFPHHASATEQKPIVDEIQKAVAELPNGKDLNSSGLMKFHFLGSPIFDRAPADFG